MLIGIDIGSTTTKIVGMDKQKTLKGTLKVTANDPITSATGALGKYLIENGISISEVEHIYITGAGASHITANLFDIKTTKVNEIEAIGKGGLYLTNKDKVLITNIGTGTAIVEANQEKIIHVGGTGVGGGTIIGLASQMINVSGFQNIEEFAQNGNIHNVDLMISDISAEDIGFIKKDMTASNFAKITEFVEKEDIALGILNMVFQVVGMMSIFAAQSRDISSVTITGSVAKSNIALKTFKSISDIYGIGFLFPENGEFATAIGAALNDDK